MLGQRTVWLLMFGLVPVVLAAVNQRRDAAAAAAMRVGAALCVDSQLLLLPHSAVALASWCAGCCV